MFIVRDNLGLNTILGFSQGFNTQYYRRVFVHSPKRRQKVLLMKKRKILEQKTIILIVPQTLYLQ